MGDKGYSCPCDYMGSHRNYPRIGEIEKRPKNTSERCRCGVIAKYRVHIQVDWFRGDDEVEWACETHKRDVDFLLETDDRSQG